MSRRILDIAIVLLAACLLLILSVGGIEYSWGFVRIRLHDWGRPLVLLAAAAGAKAALEARREMRAGRARSAMDAWCALSTYVATRGLLALLLAAGMVYAAYQVRVCGGLDSYGYVSSASLIASGRLREPQPLVALLPFENASRAAAPLGYVAAPDGHTQVPRFPLGLPVVMALFKILFGSNGPFFVPLSMAYVTIAVSLLLASSSPSSRRDALTGLFAAALVAVDPLMADSAIQPMSDVPAACWLFVALWVRLQRPRWPVAAGICAGMAFLTRPALLLACFVLAIVMPDGPAREDSRSGSGLVSRPGWRQTVRFCVTLSLFVALQMATNIVLFGNVRVSGYGPASYMFELSLPRLAANASNFGKWLTRSHGVVFWLLWPGALVVLRRSKWAWHMSAVAAAAALPYLFYLVFDDWESSRFLLATILIVLVLTAKAISVLSADRPAARAVAMLMLALAFAAASHRFLQREDVYRLRDAEAKYALAGHWIAAHTPERAVVLAGLHSGSVRFYGGRQTIRWDQIPSDKLSATLQNLKAAGYEPYLVLDVPSEPPLFAERFRGDPSVRMEQIGRVRVVNFYQFMSAH